MILALPSPQLIELGGRDAVAFANAQFCNDVANLPLGRWQYNAWLNPQGRVHALFMLLHAGPERLLLLLRGAEAAPIAAELLRYRFRSKVEVSALTGWQAAGAIGVDAWATLGVAADSFSAEHGNAVLTLPGALGLAPSGSPPRLLLLREPGAVGADTAQLPAAPDAAATAEWLQQDIRAGLPWLDGAGHDQFLPQALGLERLHGVSFSKGCYPGQEIVARVHFKGGNKRALYRIEFAATAEPLPGATIHAEPDDGAPLGNLLQSVVVAPGLRLGLAVLREDALAEARVVGAAGAILALAKC